MITDYVNNMAMKFICFNFIIAFIILYNGGLPHSEGESRNWSSDSGQRIQI